jgi:membrane protein DedA with SNARE-associated domain
MRLLPFCVYTLIGATMWNSFLLWLGYILRQNWMLVQQYSHELDMLVAIGLVAVTIWFVAVHLRRGRAVGATSGD